jgi:hypothetical protein
MATLVGWLVSRQEECAAGVMREGDALRPDCVNVLGQQQLLEIATVRMTRRKQ